VVERVAQHRHCRECRTAVPPREEFCSDACREAFVGKLARKRRQLLMLYLGSVVVLVLAVLFLR
jgi:predicted nucleic acid-binding Zn ribbon protein